VPIQVTNRFFGFHPKVCECVTVPPDICAVICSVSFPPGVELPCKLFEVAAYLVLLGIQVGKRRQCILAAMRHHNGVLDVYAVQVLV
jgi:hypothetical protein